MTRSKDLYYIWLIQSSGHGSIRSRDQIPVKVRVGQIFYFTKCLPENLNNTRENDKERL